MSKLLHAIFFTLTSYFIIQIRIQFQDLVEEKHSIKNKKKSSLSLPSEDQRVEFCLNPFWFNTIVCVYQTMICFNSQFMLSD